MKNSVPDIIPLSTVVALFAFMGCSTSESTGTSTGESPGSGGTVGSGGASSLGGASAGGSGGVTDTGGSAATGGRAMSVWHSQIDFPLPYTMKTTFKLKATISTTGLASLCDG